jgi:glycosyltransferase involved in cell wall biosynthesis
MPGNPLISIITPVFNAKNELECAIDVVKRQTYANKEHIVIDGGSTDGTLEILKKKDNDVEYWLSEADAGIYDALNKGIDAATGDWLYFLGVDDVFYQPDTLESIFKYKDIPNDVSMLYGNVQYKDGKVFKARFKKSIYLENTIHHQGVFYRNQLFEKFRYGCNEFSGIVNQYCISGDYQLNLKLFMQGTKCINLNMIIARCGNGISAEGKLRGYLEEISIRHQYIGFFKALFFDLFTLPRFFYRRFVKRIIH